MVILRKIFLIRNKVIPWISSIGNLSNFNVIDVIWLHAEQVKSMIALDIDKSTEVCRDRCRLDNIE